MIFNNIKRLTAEKARPEKNITATNKDLKKKYTDLGKTIITNNLS